MKWTDTELLPKECLNCNDDCHNCDHAGERWYLSEADVLRLKRKSLEKAVVHFQKQIEEIDRKLANLAGTK